MWLLLATDGLILVLHLLHQYSGYFTASFFSVEQERGLGETFQYLKEYWLALLLASLWLRTRRALYVGWALLFAVLLADDAFRLHEGLGTWLVTAADLQPAWRLRAQDWGELGSAGVYALLVGALIGLPYAFGRPVGRVFTHRLLLILALGAFGVGMDMLHSLLRDGPGHRLTGLVEDGGEMAVMSLMAAFVFTCAGQTAGRSRPAPAGAPLPTR